MTGGAGAHQPEDAQYVELLWPVVPKGDVHGSLDWVSGVIALDVSHEHWREIDRTPPEVREPALRAYAHELVHFLQFATLGFAHDWAADLLDRIRPVVKRVQGATPQHDFSGVKRLIREGAQLLTAEERRALEAHFLRLDTPSHSGLTARAILEGHAYFVERRLGYKMARPSDWTPHLQTAPSLTYRLAFDALACAVGYGVAYTWFSAVASVSLCSVRPAATFERLALALARAPDVHALAAEPGSASKVMAVLRQLAVGALSSPLFGIEKTHPIFSGSAVAIRRASDRGEVDTDELFVRPESQIPALRRQDTVDPPIIFRPAPPRALTIEASRGQKQGVILALFTLGAVGQRLTQPMANHGRAQGERQLEQMSWVARDHTVVLCDLAADDLRSGDPSRLVLIFEPHGEMAAQKRQWWGRVAIRLPNDPKGEARLPEVPEVRRLFQALHRRLPMFPLYLSPATGGLYDWFGSIGPEAALGPGGIDLTDDGVLGLVHEAERAIEDCGRETGQNPWLAMQCLFAPLYDLPAVEP